MFAVQCAQFFGMAVHWCSDGAADGSITTTSVER